jgi:UDP-N-acetylglucosamine 2-epimerase (non-hydrolysing)
LPARGDPNASAKPGTLSRIDALSLSLSLSPLSTMIAAQRVPPLAVSVAIGTRPEAIKLLPVVSVLREHPGEIRCRVVSTGQHREMLEQVFEVFGVVPDADLRLMQPGQSLEASFARALVGMAEELARHPPDLLLVQGDTTTVFGAALAAFWRRCPVGHVEAGLRSGEPRDPFPEEMNRILTGNLADLHFAPTAGAARNLLRAGVPPARIHVTGNTVIDALQQVSARVPPGRLPFSIDPGSILLLVTVHRRESFGDPLREILSALREIGRLFPAVEILLPVHPNPHVRDVVRSVLERVPRVHLLPPLGYADFIAALKSAYLVLTDSGGVQEEAPALGKPVLILRNTTERPEGVACGVARLVGTTSERIVRETGRLLEDPRAYEAMARAHNPYGDGRAARRIVDAIRHQFGLCEERPAEFTPSSPSLAQAIVS